TRFSRDWSSDVCSSDLRGSGSTVSTSICKGSGRRSSLASDDPSGDRSGDRSGDSGTARPGAPSPGAPGAGSPSPDAGLLSPVRAGTEAEAATGDAAYLAAMLDAEAALARAQARLGIIPRDAAEAI